MSLDGLTNPVERSGLLPGMMNYRGQWSAGQYFRNDVVQSPADGQLYMLATFTTQSSVDPALQPPPTPWLSFAGAAGPASNPMNWKDNWSAVTTYYQGDVAVSPVSLKAYVLEQPTSLNQEPSVSAAWNELEPAGPWQADASATITSAAAVGTNPLTFGGTLAGTPLASTVVYLFSTTCFLTNNTGAPVSTQAYLDIAPAASIVYRVSNTNSTTIPDGDTVALNLTGIIGHNNVAAQAITGNLILTAGVTSASYTTPLFWRIIN